MKTTILFQLAGLAQLGMVGAGALAPLFLRWKPALQTLPTILRQLFWTYGAYILSTNLFFAVLCLLFPAEFVNRSPLAAALCLYLFLFWLGRLGVQFFYFDRAALGHGIPMRIAEFFLVLLILTLVLIYGWGLWLNLG